MGYDELLVHVVTLLMNSRKYVPVLIAGLLSSLVRFMSPQTPTPTPIASVIVGQLTMSYNIEYTGYSEGRINDFAQKIAEVPSG